MDRRIGETDSEMSAEDKMLKRFAVERSVSHGVLYLVKWDVLFRRLVFSEGQHLIAAIYRTDWVTDQLASK